jgi:hypothetical protein
MEGTPRLRAWADALEQRDPQFINSYAAMRERILKDGAIPAKYKLLMGMITDAVAAHPDGVKRSPTTLAPQAPPKPRSPRRSKLDTCTAAPRRS